jgi:phage shock protein A
MIQEMEETLVETRASAARLIADAKGLKRRRRRLDEAQADWGRKAELAVARGRDDLARGALAERSCLAAMTGALDEELTALDEGLARYEEDIGRLQAKLDEAKARQKAILARQETATHRLRVQRTADDGRIERAFVRFEQMERRVDRLDAELEAHGLGRGRALEDELAQLERSDAVEAELEALKARLRRDPGAAGGGAG